MENTYKVSIYCSNCGHSSTAEKKMGVSIGQEANKKCPNCGCATLSEKRYEEKLRWNNKDLPPRPERIWMSSAPQRNKRKRK